MLLLILLSIIVALLVCVIYRKRSFKELCLFIGGISVCKYVWLITIDINHYDKWLIPVIYGVSYGAGCFLIFTVSIRILHSRLIFALSSSAITLLLIYLNINAAQKGNLTQRINGYDLYINGQWTNIGLVYEAMNPYGFMAIYAVLLFIFPRMIFKKILA